MSSSSSIPDVPPPWALKGDVYIFTFWTPKTLADNFPSMVYSPLEAQSSFADKSLSKPLGGLSMIQVIRYYESPVGPYDELILVPGYFAWSKEGKDGKRIKGQNVKITRI